MVECHGVNNPVKVPWTRITVHLPKLVMPFPVGTKGVFSGGPHNWYDGYQTLDNSDEAPGSGLDIAMTGKVLAVATGTVIEVENGNGDDETCRNRDSGLGCWVAIRNDFSGTVVVYGHILPGDKVKVGHWVEPEMEIGAVESCSGAACVGGSPAAHLHLELWDGRSAGTSGTELWGTNELSWHGAILGSYLISGGFVSVDESGNTGNVYDYDGTAVKIQGAGLDVHRLYTQPELKNLLDSDDYVFEKYDFYDANNTLYAREMYTWLTKDAWERCNTHPFNGWCEQMKSEAGTVFAEGALVAGANLRSADETEPILESSSVARPYDPLFSPPDNPSDPSTCAPTADQVALYDDAGYGTAKPCKLLDIGNHDSLGSLDNATSSVRVGANVKLTLYSEPNRSGANETFTSDDPDLDNNEIIQRNEASSALVQSKGGGTGGCQPNDYQAALFDDVYFNPNKPCRLLDIGDYSSLGDIDNITSSVKVGSKVRLVLFEDPSYGTPTETFYHDDYNLADNDHIQKNEASSAKVMLREAGGYDSCNENRSPGETEVILFDNPRYGGGSCAILKVGDYPDLSTISFENLASSLRVGSKVRVIVCTKKNYDESEASGGECETYKGDVPDLDEEGEVPRNEISSARVEMRLLCNPLPDGVVLYESSNYQDGCTTLTAGTWNLSDFRYDDMVSSLRFVGTYASGWTARMCQGENLTGTCSTFTGDDSTLSGDAVGNDRTNSIAIAPLPPALTPSLNDIANPGGLSIYHVSWTVVSNAIGYELEEQLDGSGWSMAYAGEAASAVLIGKSQGTWCYRVRAVNSAGGGPWSSSTTCTTVDPPVADPDLKVNGVAPNILSPSVGQGITVEVAIQNVGQGAAGPSSCALYRGDPTAGGTQIAAADCGTLSPNTNGVVSFNWTPNQAGQVTLFVVADNDDTLTEADETNNRDSVTVDVQEQTVTCYTLTPTHTGEGGDAAPSPASSASCSEGSYEAGTSITLEADPAPGWRVKNWSGTNNNNSVLTTNSVLMPASNHTVGVTYEVLPATAPTITGFTPTSGSVGALVTITGANLKDVTAVAFNGTVATVVNVVPTALIYAEVPQGATTGKITVTTPEGTASSTADFIVTEELSAGFSASPTWGFSPLTVNFFNTSTGQLTFWLWDFGDEQTTTDWSPTHTYYTPGTYSVSLTVYGSAGSDTETKIAYIQVQSAGATQFLFLPSILASTENRSSGSSALAPSQIEAPQLLTGQGRVEP